MSYETIFAKAMKNFKIISALSLTIAGLLLGCTAARADSLIVSLSPSVISIPISELTFPDTFAGFLVTLTYEGSMQLQLNGFFVYPNPDLGPGISYSNIPLTMSAWPNLNPGEPYTNDEDSLVLDIESYPTAKVGSYEGELTVEGGVVGPDNLPIGPYEIFGEGNFTLDITPEPSSFLLLGSGLVGLLGMLVWRGRGFRADEALV